MNEIELQKLLIKDAFSRANSLPTFGGLSEENSAKLRSFIWK